MDFFAMYLRSLWLWKVNSNDKHKTNRVINELVKK